MTIGIYNMLMESYTSLFADFLHINFITRIFLFIVFILFIGVILEGLIIPIFLWLFGPIIAKGWNFAVTETISELIYIKFLSDTSKVPSERMSALYNKQLRKLEKNNEYINSISESADAITQKRYRRIINRKIGSKTGQIFEKFIILFAVVFIISTFTYDFAYSRGLGTPQASNKSTISGVTDSSDNSQLDNGEITGTELSNGNEDTDEKSEATKYFVLSEGTAAANIRSEPSFETSSVITQVTNKATLEYTGESAPFEDGSGALWYKIKTEDGTIGWISGRIVVEKE